MKKIILLVTPLIFGLTCKAQQKIQLQGKNRIEASIRVSKLSNNEVSTFANNSLKDRSLNYLFKTHPETVYKVGDVTIMIRSGAIKPFPNYLNHQKDSNDKLYAGDPHYWSSIDTVDEKAYCSARSDLGDGNYNMVYYCINPTNDFIVTGMIVYSAKDEGKAKRALQNIIKGIRFAVQKK